jgi:chitodextrinase
MHMKASLRSLVPAAGSLALAALLGAATASAQSRDRTAPTPPANLVVTSTTEHSVSLAWQPSTDNSGRFSYVICCAGSTVTVPQTSTSHTIDGLKPGQTYTFRVYAKDAAGNLSRSSNAVTVTLPGQIAAPTKPVVQILDVGPTHATLSWSSTDDGPTILYTIYIDGQPVSSLMSRTATFTCARVLVSTYCDPLNQSTTYAFTVRAQDADGNVSPLSAPAFVTTRPIDPADLTAPTPPANVTAENGGGFVTVRWDASTDDRAPQSLIRYDVYVNGELSRVVVGQTAAEVEVYAGVNEITVIAVDTADRESLPGRVVIGP